MDWQYSVARASIHIGMQAHTVWTACVDLKGVRSQVHLADLLEFDLYLK